MDRTQGIALSSIRVGHKYKLTNYGEAFDAIAIEITSTDDIIFQDITTLEKFSYQDVIRFGKGEDFSIWEI